MTPYKSDYYYYY